jgi:plastocyanin
VVIANFSFSPTALRVPAGTVVTFRNTDGAVHTATASDKSFDSGRLTQGAEYKTTLTKSVTYFCDIHQYMTGKIEVAS